MSYTRLVPFFRDIYNGMSTWSAFNGWSPAEKFDIGMMQKMLKFCGEKDNISAMSNISVDGIFGTGTNNALTAFQNIYGLTSIPGCQYGIFDAFTAYYVNEKVNQHGGLPSGTNTGAITLNYVNSNYWHGVITPTQIVIHWTSDGSTTGTADRLRDIFNNGGTSGCGAHFYIDDHQIIQCAPLNQKLYHCNNENYKSIGIEMCVNAGGNWFETERATTNLVKSLKSQYGIATVKKHSDCSGASTLCPYPYNAISTYWTSFLSKL